MHQAYSAQILPCRRISRSVTIQAVEVVLLLSWEYKLMAISKGYHRALKSAIACSRVKR
jgi:hypothetical protein